MARPLRIQYPGAVYHITSRGDGKETIFHGDRDRLMFLALLAEVCERFNWVVHAYCLMGNHYHLLAETPDANLVRGMRQLNGVYTQRFNRVHGRVGHVYQGRYHSVLIEKESYLLEVARYVVLNPVRAGLAKEAGQWIWSSYLATAGYTSSPAWLAIHWTLSFFGGHRREATLAYQKFIAGGRGQPNPWEQLNNQTCLGSPAFLEKIQAQLPPDVDLREVPRAQRWPAVEALDSIVAEYGTRNEAIRAAYASGGYTMRAIGDHFGLHYSRVSQILRRHQTQN